MSNRLLKTYETVDRQSLDDLIYIAALNVENALLLGGAVPGKDYTILDLYRLGNPYAVAMWNERGDIKITLTGP